jgi:hypothetical protein
LDLLEKEEAAGGKDLPPILTVQKSLLLLWNGVTVEELLPLFSMEPCWWKTDFLAFLFVVRLSFINSLSPCRDAWVFLWGFYGRNDKVLEGASWVNLFPWSWEEIWAVGKRSRWLSFWFCS